MVEGRIARVSLRHSIAAVFLHGARVSRNTRMNASPSRQCARCAPGSRWSRMPAGRSRRRPSRSHARRAEPLRAFPGQVRHAAAADERRRTRRQGGRVGRLGARRS